MPALAFQVLVITGFLTASLGGVAAISSGSTRSHRVPSSLPLKPVRLLSPFPLPTSPKGSTCSNGLPGIEERGACCVLECGECGAPDCSAAGGFGAESCCVDRITEVGTLCTEKGAAPCVVDDFSSTSVGGGTGLLGTNGDMPSSSPPASPAAVERILDSVTPSPADDSLSTERPTTSPAGLEGGTGDDDSAPSSTTSSTSSAAETCNNGIPGIQSSQACCVLECGQCGGQGCTTAGRLGQSYCCSDIILNSDISCSVSGAAPCIVEEYSSTATDGGGTSFSATGSLVSVNTCDELKSAIETGGSRTYELASDITCDETIMIAERQDVTLTSAANAPRGKYSVNPASSFTGGTSSTTSTASQGGAGSDSSMFVIESGGSLSAISIIFDSVSSDGGSDARSTTTMSVSSNGTTISDSPTSLASEKGVRAIYNAGDVTVQNCDFLGPGDGEATSVTNGGAIHMADADDERYGPSSLTCIDSSFDGNAVEGSGGAIYAQGSGPLDVSGSTFEGNRAGTIDTSGDDDDDAVGSGGAIYAGSDVLLNVNDTAFEGNSAIDGGAIACSGGTLFKVAVIDTATSEGFGAVVISGGGEQSDARVLTISGSRFEGNDGGGVAVVNTNVNVTDSAFVNNDGAVYFETSDPDRGFDLRMNGVDFAGNGPPPSSWSGSDGVPSTIDSVGSGYVVIKGTGTASSSSVVVLGNVTCAEEEYECAIVIDDSSFEPTGNTDCGVCNGGGGAVEVADETASKGDGGGSRFVDSTGFIVPVAVIALLVFCLCFCCWAVAKRDKTQEDEPDTRRESRIPSMKDRA